MLAARICGAELVWPPRHLERVLTIPFPPKVTAGAAVAGTSTIMSAGFARNGDCRAITLPRFPRHRERAHGQGWLSTARAASFEDAPDIDLAGWAKERSVLAPGPWRTTPAWHCWARHAARGRRRIAMDVVDRDAGYWCGECRHDPRPPCLRGAHFSGGGASGAIFPPASTGASMYLRVRSACVEAEAFDLGVGCHRTRTPYRRPKTNLPAAVAT